MAEIERPLVFLREGEAFTADSDGAFVITSEHTHSDLLRYIVADVGKKHAMQLLASLKS